MGFGANAWLAVPLLAVTLVSTRAAGQAPPEPIRTEVRAVATCSNGVPFFARVRARTANVRPADPGEEARVFRVAVTVEGARYVGRLTIEERGHVSRPREVSAKGCDDVLSALALVAALAIDPNAVTTPVASASASTPPPAPSTTAPPPAVQASPPPAAAAMPAPSATDAPPPRAAATPAATPPAATPPATAGPGARESTPAPLSLRPAAALHRWALAAAVDVVVAGTTPLPRAGLHLRHAWQSGASLGVALSLASGNRTIDVGSAHLLWATATVEACPFRWAVARSLFVSPCLAGEGGALLVGGGANVPSATTPARPWFSVGALARVDVPLGERFFLEARGGVALPLVRDTFYFLPATDVYEAPAVVGWGGIAGGVTFP